MQTNPNENEEVEIDLMRLAKALWDKALVIVLVTVLFAGIALSGTILFITPTYEAEALMYVNSSNVSLGSTKLSISTSELSAAQSLIKTYSVILNTRSTLNEVIAQSGVSYTYEDLKTMISAESVNSTEVFSVKVTSTSPTEAELIANTIAKVLPEKISSIVEGSSVRIVDYAVTPTHRASPSMSKNTVLGALIGAVLACGVVIVLELMDDKIHDSDYLLQTYNIPVLAVIPDLLTNKAENNAYAKSAEQRAKSAR